jgi:hypothetical protein
VTKRSDIIALRPNQVPVRPAYALGVLLDSEDFFAEQSYHRARQARALKYLFGPGTAAGLQVVWREAEQQLAVNPGLAVDSLGRLIELARPVAIKLRGGLRPDDSWFDLQLPQDLSNGVLADELIADVFVRLAVCEHALTPAFATGPFDAIDAASPTRLRDGLELALVIRTEAASGSEPPTPDDSEILATQPADRTAALQWARERILAGWRDRDQDWTGGDDDPLTARPLPLQEHLRIERAPLPDGSPIQFPFELISGSRRVIIRHDPSEVGKDPCSVLLARVRIGVSTATDPPTDLGQPLVPDNTVRRFLRSSGVYTQPGGGE